MQIPRELKQNTNMTDRIWREAMQKWKDAAQKYGNHVHERSKIEEM